MTAQHVLKKHAALLDDMAAHMGVDLEAAFETPGALRLDELGDAVLRCTNCADPGHCTAWLQQDREARAPSYCQNRDLLHRLKGALG